MGKGAGISVCRENTGDGNSDRTAAAAMSSQATPRTEDGSPCDGQESNRSQLVQYHQASERERYSTLRELDDAEDDSDVSETRSLRIQWLEKDDSEKIHGDCNHHRHHKKPIEVHGENDQQLDTTFGGKERSAALGGGGDDDDAKDSPTAAAAGVSVLEEACVAPPRGRSRISLRRTCCVERASLTSLELLDDLFSGAKHAKDNEQEWTVPEPPSSDVTAPPPKTSVRTVPEPPSSDVTAPPSKTSVRTVPETSSSDVTAPPSKTIVSNVPKPSSLLSDSGREIVICGNIQHNAHEWWAGNKSYDIAVASHAEAYRQSHAAARRRILKLLERQFHFQYYLNHEWCTMGYKPIRKKLHRELRLGSATDTTEPCAPTGPLADSTIRKVIKRNLGPVDTTASSIAGSANDPMDKSPVRQKRKLEATNLHLEHYQQITPPTKRKHIVRAHDDTTSSRRPSHIDDDKAGTGLREERMNQPTKLVVYCAPSARKDPGNLEYMERVAAKRLQFLESCESERTKIVESFMNRFDFQRSNNKNNKWQSADEDWARMKVRKALLETRAMVVRTINPEEEELEPRESVIPAMTSQHLHRFSNSEYPYIEELAFHYYSGRAQENGDAEPLPLPGPIPEAPKDGDVTWTFDELSRVYLANFSRVEFASDVHKRFLGELMERDDITVVCEGLLGGLQNEQDFLDSVGRSFRNDPHHKFRRFERREQNGDVSYHEIDGYVTIKVSDFLAYLRILKGEDETTPSFVVYDQTGKSENISADEAYRHVFYMIDVDMPKMLVRINEEYKRNFKIKEILPGGAWCMMNHLPKQTRPFMGPNCYITPGGGYTQIHQDGHGTVDSGHSNVRGFNEVVMLRRLPECHKRNACREIPSFKKCRADIMAQNMLYKLPHDDGREDTPNWPTDETVCAWRAKNYCPSVFILKEGQHVLVNKGRLHAFRKLTIDSLPENDCHASLRCELIRQENLKQSPLCISIAFDWMFTGITAEGMNREAASTLECTSLCRDNKCKSLAIPETAILKLASLIPTEIDQRGRDGLVFHSFNMMNSEYRPNWKDIARGILPSLRHIVRREDKTVSGNMTNHGSQGAPDSMLDCSGSAIDPFGNDYFCKLCDCELPNTYYHCEGCETLLSKDFNICSLCFEEKKFLENKQMHEGNTELHPNRDHVGMPFAFCRCGTLDSRCHICSKCMTCCACICHTVFSKRSRFYSAMDLKELLQNTEALVGSDEIEYARETECRLDRVALAEDFQSTNECTKASCLADLSSSEETPISRRHTRQTCRHGDNGKSHRSVEDEKGSRVEVEIVAKDAKMSIPQVNAQRSIISDVSVSSYSTDWRSVPIAEEKWNDTDLLLSLKNIV